MVNVDVGKAGAASTVPKASELQTQSSSAASLSAAVPPGSDEGD